MDEPAVAEQRVAIFISHRHEDRHLARLLSDELMMLSQDRVEVLFSGEMRAGVSYRDWIRKSIARADLLVLLLADDEPLTQWCGYEVGRFLQRCEDLGEAFCHRFVCLKNAYVAAPPGPIEEFQAVDGEPEPIFEFLITLLEKGGYSGGRPVVVPYADFYAQARASAVRLAAAMSPLLSSVRFHGRLTIEYDGGGRALDDPSVEFALDDIGDIAGKLGCPPDVETLSALRAAIGHTPAGVWLEELDSFLAVNSGAAGSGQRMPVLSAFQDGSGVKYIPVIHSVRRIGDRPKSVEVLFVVMPDALRDIVELERRDPLAMRQFEIIRLMRAGRRFRYDVVDPFLHEIEQAKIEQARGDFDTQRFRRTCQKFLRRLKRLIQEGEEDRYRSYSVAADLFDLPSEEYMEEIYLDYSLVNLTDAIERFDLKEMRRALKAFRALNKKFMLIAAEAYLRKIDEMKPRDVRRVDVIAAAFNGGGEGDDGNGAERRRAVALVTSAK